MAHTLLLNADAQPVSYLPLSIIKWKEAITYLWLDKVTVLEWYDDWMVHSASWETRVPAVIMLKEMQRRRRRFPEALQPFIFKTLRVHRPPIPVFSRRDEDGAKTGRQYSENCERVPKMCVL